MALGAAALLALTGAAPARAATCGGQERVSVSVPGAEKQKNACLDDLTTAGTQRSGHTDPTDWSGLHARGTRNPTGVPGLQVDGYFPDTSTTNATHGWFHDAQFVIRLPLEWNGKLVITGAPGVRRQYANDFIISDWVLAKGYAFASTDKGNTGVRFYKDGEQPGDALAEWHRRVKELTVAAKEVADKFYGRAPRRTYMTGVSNGGYLTRWALERNPELYDGGVDWEGTLLRPDGPNLFTYLPPALRNYPEWKLGSEAAHRAMLDAGLEPGSEFLWDDHMVEYWDITQRVYREEFDPEYDGPLDAGIPFCRPATRFCDADYVYESRPQAVRDAVGRVSLSGAIGKPMLTLHGTYDALLPIRTDSDVYARMVGAAGKARLHRYYAFEAGNHVDSRFDRYGDRIRPLLPCYRTLFEALERWVEDGKAPPPSQFVPHARQGDIVNECSVASRGDRASVSPPLRGGPAGSSADRRLKPRGLRVRVRPRRDRRPRYRYRVDGRLLLPAGIGRAQGCRGRVTTRIGRRGRTIARRRSRVRRNCTFRTRASFGRHRSGRRVRGRLRLTVRFLGNAHLQPVRARSRQVRAG